MFLLVHTSNICERKHKILVTLVPEWLKDRGSTETLNVYLCTFWFFNVIYFKISIKSEFIQINRVYKFFEQEISQPGNYPIDTFLPVH